MNKVVPSADQVLLDPSASNWIKDALVAVDKRDICDALSDAELLVAILQDRFHRITQLTNKDSMSKTITLSYDMILVVYECLWRLHDAEPEIRFGDVTALEALKVFPAWATLPDYREAMKKDALERMAHGERRHPVTPDELKEMLDSL